MSIISHFKHPAPYPSTACLTSSNQMMIEKTKQNRDFCDIKTFRSSYNTKPVNKIAFQIVYLDPGSEINEFLSHPALFSFIRKPFTWFSIIYRYNIHWSL